MNRFIALYQNQSAILSGRNDGFLNQPVVPGDLGNLKSHLLQIKGNADGVYFNSSYKPMPSKLTLLREQEKQLRAEWKRHCDSRVQLGEPKPTVWPEQLQERKDKLDARLQVAGEEIAWLEEKIRAAEANKTARDSQPVNPQFWGAGRLSNGILVEFCGWDVVPDDTGLLRIQDETSPYNTMEIWRLKSQVVNPLHFEFRVRQRKETAEAQAENRPKRNTLFPAPPQYNKSTDLVEYPADWDPSTVRKVKLEDENI